MLPLGIAERFACPAKTVKDVCDNNVSIIDHVIVALGDKDDLCEHEVDGIPVAVCFAADIELRDFVQSVCAEIADCMKSDVLFQNHPKRIALIAF